jgi:hypothetical protein
MAPTTDTEKIKVRDSIRSTIRFIRQYLLPLGQSGYTVIEVECQRIRSTKYGAFLYFPRNPLITLEYKSSEWTNGSLPVPNTPGAPGIAIAHPSNEKSNYSANIYIFLIVCDY